MTDPKGSKPARPVPGHFLAKGEDIRMDLAKAALVSLSWWQATSPDALRFKAETAVAQADALIAALASRDEVKP